MIKTVLLFCFAFTLLQAAHKVEVKYTLPELMQLPAPILEALETGSDHPDILRRGFVVQHYLAVTKKNIARLFEAVSLGSKEDLEFFIYPGKTQEIRLMHKTIKENGSVKEFYQVTLFGSGGVSCARLDTSELLYTCDQFLPEVTATVQKAFFELKIDNEHSVEVDIFLEKQNGKIVPTFIDGEIKFQTSGEAELYRQHPSVGYLGVDITDEPRCKARNIALHGVPAALLATFHEHKQANQFHTSKIVAEYTTWAALEAFEPTKALVQKKVLLNAEAFGFGPTAAIAEIFPYFRDRVVHLGYAGSGHTLDLQSKLPYDKVYDLRRHDFSEVAQNYDVFITASDFETAARAKELGMTVIIYDPLTWYWQKLPDVIAKADLYVAQNFFGVQERLTNEAEKFPECAVVPAIISGLDSPKRANDESTLLVNLGGLSNPYVSNELLIAYAKIVLGAIRDVMEPSFKHCHYVSSKAIAGGVGDVCPVVSMLPHQVQKILSTSKLAVMTSGLGNIFEASAMRKQVLWLPPANDSQGQQCKLLQQHQMADFAIDWHDILDTIEPIDYFADQQMVLQQISHCMQRLAASPDAQNKLRERLKEALLCNESTPPALSQLAETFELGGAKACADTIIQFLMGN